MQFRTLTATARAAATGLTNIALGRVERAGRATACRRSSRRTSRCRRPMAACTSSAISAAARPSCIAWFPRAFTPAARPSVDRSARATRAARAERAVFRGERGLAGHQRRVRAVARACRTRFCPTDGDDGPRVRRAVASGFPSRWTFYIGLDGRILDIDRQVHVSAHGSDVAARLRELGIS